MCAWKECDWDPVVYVCLYIKFAIVFNRCHMRWPTKYLIRRWLRLYSCSPRVCLSFLQLWHCCSVTKSCLTLRPHGLQHARLPWPSPSPGVCSISCPLSWWCYPTHLILCHFLLLLPSIFPSVRVLSNELVLCIRWPKYWRFSFSISASNEYSGLISFKMDWFSLLAVQGTLKSLLQHHSSKASVLQHSVFFMVH